MDLSEFYQPKNKSCLFAKVATKLKQDDLEKVEAALLEKDITIASIAVSYTHLTLPTNREV